MDSFSHMYLDMPVLFEDKVVITLLSVSFSSANGTNDTTARSYGPDDWAPAATSSAIY